MDCSVKYGRGIASLPGESFTENNVENDSQLCRNGQLQTVLLRKRNVFIRVEISIRNKRVSLSQYDSLWVRGSTTEVVQTDVDIAAVPTV